MGERVPPSGGSAELELDIEVAQARADLGQELVRLACPAGRGSRAEAPRARESR